MKPYSQASRFALFLIGAISQFSGQSAWATPNPSASPVPARKANCSLNYTTLSETRPDLTVKVAQPLDVSAEFGTADFTGPDGKRYTAACTGSVENGNKLQVNAWITAEGSFSKPLYQSVAKSSGRSVTLIAVGQSDFIYPEEAEAVGNLMILAQCTCNR